MPLTLARMYSVSSSALAEQLNNSLAVRMDNLFFLILEYLNK